MWLLVFPSLSVYANVFAFHLAINIRVSFGTSPNGHHFVFVPQTGHSIRRRPSTEPSPRKGRGDRAIWRTACAVLLRYYYYLYINIYSLLHDLNKMFGETRVTDNMSQEMREKNIQNILQNTTIITDLRRRVSCTNIWPFSPHHITRATTSILFKTNRVP